MPYTPGPFDRKHLLLVWGGKLPGNESWSCSLKLADGRSSSPAALNNAYLDQVDTQESLNAYVKDAVLAYHINASTHINNAAKLSFAKLNLIDVDGHYDSEATSEYIFADVAGGGGGAPSYPNQIALCVSLTTGVTRGPAHRGRFYLPLPALNVANGLADPTEISHVVTATKTFLEALSDVPGLDLPSSPGAVVMSRKAGSPRTRTVTGVAVGRVLDTQRRRRRSLIEGYALGVVDQGLA